MNPCWAREGINTCQPHKNREAMRGKTELQQKTTQKTKPGGPSDPHHQDASGRGVASVVTGLRPDVFADRAPIDSAGASAERMLVDVPVQHPERAAALRAAALRHAVSVLSGLAGRWPNVRPVRVRSQSRPAAAG